MAARSKSSGPRKPSGKTAPAATAPTDERILDAALRVAARDGWRAAAPARIAAEAGVGLAVLHATFPSRAALLAGLARRIDRAVLASVDAAPLEGSPRDRLFDIVMRRFDALQPLREALIALGASGVDPVSGVALVGALGRSMAWMLAAAGLDVYGVAGALRVAGLSVVYVGAFRVWLKDDQADLGKTMAALDRGLARAERWASALPGAGAPDRGAGSGRD